jgi:hypothetical protein
VAKERASAVFVEHLTKEGKECASGLWFDTPETRKVVEPNRPLWQVQSYDPLTISPSILCMRCGDHGFIRNGKWEAA